MNVLTHSGVLRATPSTSPARADAKSPPLRCAEDYAVMQEFAHDCTVPVLVTYRQYYAWIAGLAKDMLDAFEPDGPLLIELTRPLGVPLPDILLAQNVLVTDDIQREVDFWEHAPVRAFCELRVRVRRDRHDFGDNTISLALHAQADESVAWTRFLATSAGLASVAAPDPIPRPCDVNPVPTRIEQKAVDA